MKQIVHKLDPVVLVGAAEATPQTLHKALTLAPTCVAADGGAALALTEGVELDCVIGDLDSLPDSLRDQIPADRLHLFTDQDDTDFEKALSRITAPVVVGVGFTGGRMDHQLAVYHSLMRFADRPCVLWGETEALFLAPPQIALPTRKGDVVSLFPMARVQGRSTGLAWPIDGIDFAPAGMIGTSNVATGPCTVTVNAPVMLMIVPVELIAQVVAQLARPDAARWPAP